MGISINGNPLTVGPIFWPPNFEKESEINDPEPSRLFVFLDRGFKSNEINEIRRMITERRAEIVERWLEHGRHAG